MDLNTIFYAILGAMLALYIILDGYDLGIGILHLFTRDESKRLAYLNMVGPYWDGHEVWLISFGGVLFAAFPHVYAVLVSVFYMEFFALLLAIILRNVSIELRNKHHSPLWHRTCDYCFGIGSLLTALLLGVMGGNWLLGMPIDQQGNIYSKTASVFSVFSVLAGVAGVTLLCMHGSLFASFKAQKNNMLHSRQLAKTSIWIWAANLLILIILELLLVQKQGPQWANNHPLLASIILVVIAAAFAYIPFAASSDRPLRAFAASSIVLASVLAVMSLQMFPNLVLSRISPSASLTAYNSASGPYTMKVVLVCAAIFLPLALLYNFYVYYMLEAKPAKEKPSLY